jgi:hypothetical protein
MIEDFRVKYSNGMTIVETQKNHNLSTINRKERAGEIFWILRYKDEHISAKSAKCQSYLDIPISLGL